MQTSSRGALLSLSLSMLLASLGTSIANVGLPALAQVFDASFHAVQWVVLAYLLAITAVIVSAGRLGDRLGRRRLLLCGLLLFAVACALCGAAPSLPGLVAARVLQGLGAASMMAMTLGLVGDTVTQERTGRVMGLLGTMSAVGTAMGPSVGGLLLSLWGWRALFLAGLPLGVLGAALAWRYLPVDRPAERATTRPSFWQPLKDPALRAGLAMSALVSAVIMATFVVGPFYLSRGLELAPAWMGLAMAVGPCVAALTGVPAGRLTDRLGSQRMTLAGLSVMATGALLLSLASGLVAYLASLVILTAGYSLFQAANNTAVMSDVQPARRGTISGLLNLSRNLGLIVGASALGAVFAWACPDVTQATPPDVANGLHVTFSVALALILLAGTFAWGRNSAASCPQNTR
ncbi:MFS transporter [Pseudomonas tolaasii]|uniref:MFS transporter n=2 Tax=Pseudomonas tolaasii TaxID=29442 RepID=A0A7Y8DPL7_PSETO|nr:MFS transporter [Pseudomonas tolaasii]ARB27572.1 MFS transporter [Pseudomonas tolaasii]KAB0467899.1 MFS transporter [Pseudomonas tolaasii]MBY8943687.1 MFS transporter [Pseudomonas tolaasii]NWC19282.1 MFS transporter [Pseudomonas tolaasii]NWC43201.1 MFS transporter [Pseudomonas tolaasii]